MNEIRNCTLSLPNLPKSLTSRRNLHAHFSKFGEVKDVNVNKVDRTAIIEFASRAEAKASKIHGSVYNGKPLRIQWYENTLETTEKSLDPRAREQEEVVEIDDLWEADDKECFGVDAKPNVVEKRSAKALINQHLKLPNVKKRSVIKTNILEKSEGSEISISVKTNKSQLKVEQTKKMLANKRKLLRKEAMNPVKVKKKTSVAKELSSSSVPASNQDEFKRKLALLTERDKLIREKTVPNSNIETAVALKGTCPDMCPERERILRQDRQQVAVYERLPGSFEMDDNKAIKEYSRSSADQDVPLPHDVRPISVLTMTMNYLINNIINKIDNDPNESKAIWYSFCWNRLRGIRKDIILQDLCDLETVTILEQCARFHISCYDHMWGIDVSGYADKYNTQTLIDCLHTLFQLYEDLSKHNVKCPNQAEFYSYMILVKLATGDVFWEYQQYAPEIQLSPKVQFAIKVYMAFINNMYSKYFNLVKQASYLEACLLQRHFDKVRTKALTVMLKAYSLRNRHSLTTSFLMNCLKFDTQTNVVRFCENIGVTLEKTTKSDEDDIDDEYVPTSSFLIREKRLPIANAVVGENNPLPIYTPHQVHTSFDEFGNLKEPLQTVLEGDYDSCDSPLDDSVVSIPEEKHQSLSDPKPFKFSLSPKVTEGNVFSTSVFSRLGAFNTSHEELNRDLPKMIPKVQKSSEAKDTFAPLMFSYEDEQMKADEMDEDIADVDMNYEESIDEKKEETRPLEGSKLFTQIEFPRKPLFSFQQSFSTIQSVPPKPPALTSSSILQRNENQSHNLMSSFNSPKHQIEASFLFTSPKMEPNKLPMFKTEAKDKLPFGIRDQFQPASFQTTREKEHHFSQNEIKSNVDFAGKDESQPSVDSAYIHKNEEKHLEALKREKEIMEKILLKKAEDERLKMEEIKRAEIERQKRIKRQEALEKLRKDLRERMKAKTARKYFRTWKSRVEKLKEKRADFPFLQQLSVEGHLELWGTVKYFPDTSVYQRAKDRQNLNTIVSQLLKNGINDSCQYVGKDLAELLAKSATRTMNVGSNRSVYWKLAMSLPWKDRSNSKNLVFHKMMRRCCKQTFYKRKDAQLGSVETVMTSLQIPVHVTVHLSEDLPSCSGLNGMDALIFVAVEGFESEKMCLDRLRSSVTVQARSSQLAVAVLTINGNKFDRVLKRELKELHEQNLISFWNLSEWNTSNCLHENLAFLTEHVNVVQDICARSLDTLVTQAVDDFIYEVDGSQVYCSALLDALENPNIVINIYNTFLTKLEDLLLSSKLEKYFNFAEDFKSHIPADECGGPELMCGKQYNNQYKTQIASKIHSLKLPEFPGWPQHTNEIDFDTLAELLETYCKTQIDDTEVFKDIIRKLAQEASYSSSNLNCCYSWLHIVELWAESRINRVFPSKEKGPKMFVIYSKSDFQQLVKKQWWITLPIVAQANKMM